jgi:nonsense-mediated mRNA decay protein 3
MSSALLPSQRAAPDVLCCMCGVGMKPNRVNTCAACLQTTHDVTSEFSKNGVLLKCRSCERYQKASTGWVFCANESKALLALCLKRIKGLHKVSLVDANFVWTEEHSKRVKVKLTVQKEVAPSVVLQQQCVVEFVVQNKMCDECHAAEASMTWDTVVQVRQKVQHKRTFLFLEQLILRHREDARTISVKAQPDGVDFFFGKKNDAARFVDFLETIVPVRFKEAKKLLSTDTKSNICIYNYTFAVEMVPTCKDDLVVLPPATARRLGNIPQLVLCTGVTSVVRFMDPLSCQLCEMGGELFWRTPFRSMLDASRLQGFTVLDVQLHDLPERRPRPGQQHGGGGGDGGGGDGGDDDQDDDQDDDAGAKPPQQQQQQQQPKAKSKKRRRNKHKNGGGLGSVLTTAGVNVSAHHRLATVEVARDEDLGVNDRRFTVTTHLGYVLKAGDSVLGYDLSKVSLNDNELEDLRGADNLPEVVLVRKHFPKWRKLEQSRERLWRLKSLAKQGDGPGAMLATGAGDDEIEALERDKEMFMRDLEEDPDMRARINLYKKAPAAANARARNAQLDNDVEEDTPTVDVGELLEEMSLGQPRDADDEEQDDDDDDEEDER